MTNTIIGSSIVIDGEITGDEELIIQGTVKGRIVLKEDLVIERSGVAEADVDIRNVTVSGQLTGNVVVSEKCEITDGGKVVGDIKAPRILISDGAIFKGNVDMEG